MIETKEVNIEDMKFSIQQFHAMTSLKLEKRTLTLLAPLLNILKGDKKSMLDEEIDMEVLTSSAQEILLNLDDNVFEEYIKDMVAFSFVTLENSATPVQLNNMQVFNGVFAGKNSVIFKLLFEIMKINKFAFFELVGGGEGIINLSKNMIKSKKT